MNKKILLISYFILGQLFLYPLMGAAMAIKSEVIEEIKKDYSKINLSDGVTEKEAIIIAKFYVINNMNYENLKLNRFKVLESGFNKDWIVISFDATFSYKNKSGLKWFDVHVDKNTGEVKSKGWGPA